MNDINTDAQDEADLAACRVDSTEKTEAAAPRRWKRPPFIMIPRTWHECLCRATYGKTYPVAVHLLSLAWRADTRVTTGWGGQRDLTLTVANGALAECGITRLQKHHALRELETLGLISVEWRDRKSPIVKLFHQHT